MRELAFSKGTDMAAMSPRYGKQSKSPAGSKSDPTPKNAAALRTKDAIGQRLLETRRALGLSQREMSRAAGVAPNTYNQYETGVARPTIDNASRLCDAHRLSLDWIYHGDPASLRVQLLEAIIAMRASKSE